MSTNQQQQVVPVFVDRCCPQCVTKSGNGVTSYNKYSTFNHHCVGRLINDDAVIKEILLDLVGTAVVICLHLYYSYY
jgi:hypothetical protein